MAISIQKDALLSQFAGLAQLAFIAVFVGTPNNRDHHEMASDLQCQNAEQIENMWSAYATLA